MANEVMKLLHHEVLKSHFHSKQKENDEKI